MKLAFAAIVLCGMAVGQNATTGILCAPENKCATTVGSGIIVMTDTSGVTKPKRCAFDLKPQTILDRRPRKPKPASEMFPQPLSSYTYGDLTFSPTRTVCPYERAIELFGEDRVDYQDSYFNCGSPLPERKDWCKHTKRVLVDGEEVYREP